MPSHPRQLVFRARRDTSLPGEPEGTDGRAVGRRSALTRSLRRLLREAFGFVPTLDLHGLGVADALAETERFLREMAARGEREVRVVYGKGRGSPGGVGVLRQAVPAWLEQHGAGLVERFERAIERDGDDGAMRVWLVRSRARSEESG